MTGDDWTELFEGLKIEEPKRNEGESITDYDKRLLKYLQNYLLRTRSKEIESVCREYLSLFIDQYLDYGHQEERIFWKGLEDIKSPGTFMAYFIKLLPFMWI